MPSLRTLPQDLRLFAKYHLKRRVYDHPARETELGIVPLGFDLASYAEQLRGVGAPFRVATLAELEHAGRTHPMLCVRSAPAPARLVVLAGVHGNEQAGLLAIPEVLARASKRNLDAVQLVVITPVNPVGAAELSRYDAHGYDVNRDFHRFDTPEARAVRVVFEERMPDFVVSLHEGPQDATFLFTNRHVDRALALRLLERLRAGGTALATENYFGSRLEPAGYSPVTPVAHALGRLWTAALGMKTSGMYCDDHGIPEITIESSWRLTDPEDRVRGHVDLVLGVLGEMAARRAP